MVGPPYPWGKAQAETLVSADDHPDLAADGDEEKTTVDPGAIDIWQDVKTVADPPEKYFERIADNIRGETAGATRETVNEVISSRPGDPNQAIALPEAELIVSSGPNEGMVFRIERPAITIGRGLKNDVVLIDPAISRHHTRIEFEGGVFFIQDLGSGNGTVINGVDEEGRHRLRHGDAIELGRSILTFSCEAMKVEAPSLEPPRPRPPPAYQPSPTRPLRGQPTCVIIAEEDLSTGAEALPPALGGVGPRGNEPQMLWDPPAPRPPAPEGPPPRQGPPRRTVASPVVPVPRRVDRPPMPQRQPQVLSQPSLQTLPQLQPQPQAAPMRPIVAPIDLDEEIETMAAATRPAPDQLPGLRPSPPTFQPAPMYPPAQAAIVYPAAPQPYSRPGPATAMAPRPAPAYSGGIGGTRRSGRGKWIVVGVVLVMVAAVVGVTLAAVTGRSGNGEKVAAGASAASDAGTASPADGGAPVIKEALSTGEVVPVATWGTDEAVLDSIAESDRSSSADGTSGGDDVGGETAKERDESRDEKKERREARARVEREAREKEKERREARARVEREAREKEKERQEAQARAKREADEGGASQQIQRQKARAESAYRDRDLAEAARAATGAAEAAKGAEARRLRKLASNYKELDRLLTTAQRNSDSRADLALSSYLRARTVDRRLGRAHGRFITNQILLVGPEAAKMFMAKKRLADAARAVEATRAAGDSTRTDPVMRSLERKARSLIAEGERAGRGGDKDVADRKIREALDILPKQSSVRAEARAALDDL
jgi:pSer/pThr/pTyr-binding forkhead associated (FHA) protein